jgi:hypothetical protein
MESCLYLLDSDSDGLSFCQLLSLPVASFPCPVLFGRFFVSLSIHYDGSTQAFVLGRRHVVNGCVLTTTTPTALSAGCKDLVRLIEAPEVSVSAACSALCDETDRCEWIERVWWSRLRRVFQGALKLTDGTFRLSHPDRFDTFTRVVVDDVDPISGASISSHDRCGSMGGSKESELHVQITKEGVFLAVAAV